MKELSHRQLMALIVIMEKKNISRAANELGISQPSLSRILGSVEKRLGTRLFERGSRGVHATEIGKNVCAHAREIVDAHLSIRNCVNDLAGFLAGPVCIALPESVGSFLSVHLINYFRKYHPHIDLRIMFSRNQTIAYYLNAGIANVGVVDETGINNLIISPLCSENFYLVSKINEIIGKNPNITMSEIIDLPLLLPALSGSIRSIINPAFAKRNIRISVAMEVDSMAGILDLVKDGFGYSLLPYSILYRSIIREEVEAKLITEDSIKRNMFTALPSNRPCSFLVRSVEKEVRKVVKMHSEGAKWNSSNANL